MEKRGGSGKSPDHQFSSQKNNYSKETNKPQHGVWDILERKGRLDELMPKRFSVYPDDSIHPRLPTTLYVEQRELYRLIRELGEKGTPRDKLILELGSRPRLRTRGLSQREQFQQFRSRVETMSEEEIVKEIRRQQEMSSAAFHPGVGFFDLTDKDKEPS